MTKVPKDRIRVHGRLKDGRLLLAIDLDYEDEMLEGLGRSRGRQVLSA